LIIFKSFDNLIYISIVINHIVITAKGWSIV